MSIVRRAAENSFFIFSGEMVVRIITFFVTLILIRYLGSGNFGKYSLVYAFLSFFDIFVIMGIDPIIVRELSRDFQKGAEFIGSAVTLKFLFSLIGIALCWIVLQRIPYPKDIKVLVYLASLSMLFSFGLLFNNIFQAKLLMKYLSIISIAMKILFAALTVMFIFLKAKLFYFVLINLIIYIAQIICVSYQSRRFLHIRVRADLAIWKTLLRDSWPLAAGIIFVTIYAKISQIMLFNIKGKEALGFYAAALKIAELPIMLAGVFMASAFPLLCKYATALPDSFKKTYEISFKYLMLFIIPFAMMVTFYSRQIIFLSYGQSFLVSRGALAILIWSTVFVYAAVVHNNILVARNLQVFDIIFTGISALLSLFLNFILIPKYGFTGAAIATTVSYGVFIPLSLSLKTTRKFAKALIKSMLKPLLAALFAGYFVYFFLPLNFIFNLALSGVIYIFLILFLRAVDSQDFRYGREIVTGLLLRIK